MVHKSGWLAAILFLFLPVVILAGMNPCELAKLTAGDAAEGDIFGHCVSISGEYAIIGAPLDDDAGTDSGAAYIFKRDGMILSEVAKLTPIDSKAEDEFGHSVSISGDYAIIGAYGDDDAGNESGAAYVFKRDGETWTEEAKLKASNAAEGDRFSRSLSISGDYIVIGAKHGYGAVTNSGTAYIFKRDGTTWTEEAKLVASDGAEGDLFGSGVSISGDYAVIGAYGDAIAAPLSGSAYIFRREGTTWIEEAKLFASDGAQGDLFGCAAAISGDYAVIGAYWADDGGSKSGAAYVFKRQGTTWNEEAKLTASDAAPLDRFGRLVAISGDYAVIGARYGDGAAVDSGSAYLFKRNGTAWTEEAELFASDGAAEDVFGHGVAISSDHIVIGAFWDDEDGSRSGSAYVFGISGTACGTGIVAGPGPAGANPPLVHVFPPVQDAEYEYEFSPYGPPHFGVNVTCGDVAGNGYDEILTGPGPGAIFGPHVRGFKVDGTPLQNLSFFAYGTRKWGVHVASGDIDDDGYDEIITGTGPGAVFGPHVRAFDYDDTDSITPVPGVSFIAYNTRKRGVHVSAGDIDGDGYDEIITGPGPGVVFGPHVRGWNLDDGSAKALSSVSFLAYGTLKYGVVVACGDMDNDGFSEIATAPGPSSSFGSHIRGWNYDDISISPLSSCSFFAWPPSEARYGARVYAGADLDLDGRDEIVVGCGPDPSAGSTVRVFKYDEAGVTEWFSLESFASGWTHGVNVAAGRFLMP